MSSATGRTGRPLGPDSETLERGRFYLALSDHGVAVSQMALQAGVAKSEVYRAMNLVRPLATVDSEVARVPLPPARPRRKMTEGTLLRRAYNCIRFHRVFKGLLDAATREFWVEVLLEIRAESEDGISLSFGQPGDAYASQAQFLQLFGGTEEQLQKLFSHAMLIDLGGTGIALPKRWGLRGAAGQSTPLGKSVFDTHQQRSMYGVVQGGRSVSGESRLYPDESGGLSPDAVSGKSRLYPDTDQGLSPDTEIFARSADADANAKDIRNLASASATESRADVSGKSRLSPDDLSGKSLFGLSGKSPAGVSGESPGEPSNADLTAELKTLVSPGRAPAARDLGAIQTMLDAGETAETIRDLIKVKMRDWQGAPPHSLGYFVNPAREAREERLRASQKAASPAPVAPPAAAAPEPADEPIVGTGPEAEWARASRKLKAEIGPALHKNWLSKAAFLGFEDGEATVSLPTAFLRDYVRTHYLDRLTAFWRAENPAIVRVDVICVPARGTSDG